MQRDHRTQTDPTQVGGHAGTSCQLLLGPRQEEQLSKGSSSLQLSGRNSCLKQPVICCQAVSVMYV